MKLSRITLFTILFIIGALSVAYAAPDMDAIMKNGGTRAELMAAGDGFFSAYAADPAAEGADKALLNAGKCYKLAFEQYADNADYLTAVKHFRTLGTSYHSEAAAEGYLEQAELFAEKKDLVTAQFVLNRVVKDYPDSYHELAAASMLNDLNTMAQGGQRGFSTLPANTYDTLTSEPNSLNTLADTINDDTVAISAPITYIPNTVDTVDNVSTPDIAQVDLPEGTLAETFLPEGVTGVKGIRYYSSSEYTRVVIDLTQNAAIEKHWLKEDTANNLPPRLFVDILDSEVSGAVPRTTVIEDGLVKSVRWAYNKPGVTRVVLDSAAIQDFTVFQMADPSRIVIDVTGGKVAAANVAQTGNNAPNVTVSLPDSPNSFTTQPGDTGTLANVLGLKIRTVVIDPGHGGKDPGCVYNNMYEKDIVLDIAKELKRLINTQHPDIQVYMTRDTDKYIPLEERTAIANKYKADLFISVHINASKNGNAKGVETYVFNRVSDKSVMEILAFENQATMKSMSDLQDIIADIVNTSKLQESLLLAADVQNSMVKTLSLPAKENLGVKQAPFYVLIGATMPSILVESGFLSNKDDAKKLSTTTHRKKLAQGMFGGLDGYIKKYNR